MSRTIEDDSQRRHVVTWDKGHHQSILTPCSFVTVVVVGGSSISIPIRTYFPLPARWRPQKQRVVAHLALRLDWTFGSSEATFGKTTLQPTNQTIQPSDIVLLLLLLSSRRDSKWLKFLEKIEISINLIAQTYVPALAAELVRKVLLGGGSGDFGEDTHSSLGWENIIVWLMVGGVGRWRFHRKEWGSVQFRVCMYVVIHLLQLQLHNFWIRAMTMAWKCSERGNCMWSYIPTNNKRSDVRMRNLLLSEVLLRRFPVRDYRDEGWGFWSDELITLLW